MNDAIGKIIADKHKKPRAGKAFYFLDYFTRTTLLMRFINYSSEFEIPCHDFQEESAIMKPPGDGLGRAFVLPRHNEAFVSKGNEWLM